MSMVISAGCLTPRCCFFGGDFVQKKRWLLWTAAVLLLLCLLGGAAVLGINAHVKHAASAYLMTPETAADGGFDCILIHQPIIF